MEAKKLEEIETIADPIGYLSDAEMTDLKAKKGTKYIHEVITIDDDEQTHATYFLKPNLDQLQMLADYAKKSEEMDGLKVLFNTCRVGGSEAVLVDDEMKASAYKALAQLFKRREAVVKKR
ncbi:hypothetical protein [Flavobacterium sp. IMCC34518]|uniref:hypothetical protein n=1 Tax=Flavobacterium sp. IMCC34518 TaxID=3003623 RepID=UPI0022AC125A|nr:hypothetical protein [Flavobacterium sp. IMCC34518]